MSVERELNAEGSKDLDEIDFNPNNLPAEPDEETKNIIQMSELEEMTVEGNMLFCPVDEVTTASNSEQWVVEMDHPVEDNIRFFLPKPTKGWTEEYRLVKVLHWYGIHNKNPYTLQTQRLYIQYDPDVDEWELARPPELGRPLGERARKTVQRVLDMRPERKAVGIWATFALGFIATGVSLVLFGGASLGMAALVTSIALAATTITAAGVFDPE